MIYLYLRIACLFILRFSGWGCTDDEIICNCDMGTFSSSYVYFVHVCGQTFGEVTTLCKLYGNTNFDENKSIITLNYQTIFTEQKMKRTDSFSNITLQNLK